MSCYALQVLALSLLGLSSTNALATPAAAVKFLHGSGDTGAGAERMMNYVWDGQFITEMAEHKISVEYPTAPPIPYTIAQGQVMNVWFDRKSLSPKAPEQVSCGFQLSLMKQGCPLLKYFLHKPVIFTMYHVQDCNKI